MALVQQEFAFNTFEPSVSKGILLKKYPITIIPHNNVELAAFTIPANKGIGHIPVILKNAQAHLALRAKYKLEGSDVWLWAVEDIAYIAENEFYQGYLNADGTMDYVMNISRPVGGLNKAMHIRIFSTGSN